MKKALLLVFTSVLCFALCACGGKKLTAAEKAQAEADAAKGAYQSISDALEKAEEKNKKTEDLVNKILK